VNNYQKAEPVPDPGPQLDHSWLGRWQDVGWAIRITPRLNDSQWKVFGLVADDTWDEEKLSYSADKSLEVLHRLFPRHELALTWPKCGKWTGSETCGAQARHTQVMVDATGARVGIARCGVHRGQL
jgi:hypothetical protein